MYINSQTTAKGKRVAQYDLSPNKCTCCHSILEYDKRNLKFCNHSCSATYINSNKPDTIRKHPRKGCAVCSAMTTNEKYCSTKCMGVGKIRYTNENDKSHARKMMQREAYARYAAKKKYQTPCDEDLTAIKIFYQNCPDGCEVDHIIPISKGGSHALTNLQYLTISENRKKSAKLNWCPEGESNARHHS
jgi:5-methylcytosine-specific restriction endonuclease McrA